MAAFTMGVNAWEINQGAIIYAKHCSKGILKYPIFCFRWWLWCAFVLLVMVVVVAVHAMWFKMASHEN